MQKVKLTVTTPNPWGDGYDPGDLTIAPKVASATKGSDLVATLQSPVTLQSEDAHVAPEATLSVYNVPVRQSTDMAARVLVPNPAVTSLVYSAVPETGTCLALAAVFVGTFAWRRLRRR